MPELKRYSIRKSQSEIERMIKKTVKRGIINTKGTRSVRTLGRINFEQESITEIEQDLRSHQEMLSQQKRGYQLYKMWEQCGYGRQDFIDVYRIADPVEQSFKIIQRTIECANQLHIGAKAISNLLGNKSKIKGDFYLDEEVNEMTTLLQDETIPMTLIISELIRLGQEDTQLLQIYLGEKRQAARLDRKLRKKPMVAVVQPQIQEDLDEEVEEQQVEDEEVISEPTMMAGWKLHYSTVDFSDQPEHFLPLLPGGINSLSEQLADISLRQHIDLGIKSPSIINAVDFHLRKSNLQRALSLRNRYIHEDWSKIKRGRSRIFLKIDEANSECVFFVGLRKDVYR